MRTKEEAHDYRYFPEPDLVPIVVEQSVIDEIRAGLPELPDARMKRFVSDFGLPEHDADFLTSEKAYAEWFEQAVNHGCKPKLASNWMMGELMKLLNEAGKTIEETNIKPAAFAELLKLIDAGTISGKIAKIVFEEMFSTGKDPKEIVAEKGLLQISDESAIEKAVDEIIAKHQKEAERFRAGEEKLLGFIVGQVMKATKGKANPQMLNDLIRKKLS
jgi:aspartyl-tRNA(Asn)/glutamyl-tRNA(Gln) amidotransferase subunit B